MDGFVLKKDGFKNDKAAKRACEEIKKSLVKIIAARSGISIKSFRELNEEKLKSYNPSSFSLDSFGIEDLQALAYGISNDTFQSHYYSPLVPFMQFFLMEEEKKYKGKIKDGNFDFYTKMEETEKFNELRTSILTSLNQVNVKRSQNDNDELKVFLTKEEYCQVFNRVYEASKQGLQRSVLLEIDFKLGLRRSEISLLAVEDFWIDENGFLNTDDEGYGRLHFPKEKSKGFYSPSPSFGNLVPPKVVELINLYLKNVLYPKCPFSEHAKYAGKTFIGNNSKKVYKDSHGFLFRKEGYFYNPDSNLTPASIGTYFRNIRDLLTFLPKEKREVFSTHDGRHTLNEWIETSIVIPKLNEKRDWAADLQMRHSAKSTDVGKKHYRMKLDEETYKTIIDASINFPYDLRELEKWEIDLGYKSADEKRIDDNGLIKIPTAKQFIPVKRVALTADEKEKLRIRSNELEELLNSTCQKPVNWSAHEWLMKRNGWLKEKEEIDSKLIS
ncbi:hypothetical protein [Neobacillus mesonae]|uniref:hypothetical protein n=1 Tax=Neobacillus mesonae TaxID=1193713 RepID=UPI000830A33D|nr:hypothetical protein [Neobacillus mesonae]